MPLHRLGRADQGAASLHGRSMRTPAQSQVPTSVMLLDASTQPRPQLIAMGTVDVVPEADVPQTQHVRLYDHFGK